MKKNIAIIISLLLSITIAISITACSKNDNKPNNETSTEIVTNENGETVSQNDNQSQDNSGSNSNEQSTSKSSSTTTKKTTKDKNKKETTTEPTTQYTTTSRNGRDLPLDSSDDDYLLTDDSALYFLEDYYGIDKYAVNYDIPNSTDDVTAFAVFKLEDKYTVVYTVKVDLKTGKATQTNTKTHKTKTIKLINN